MDETKAKEILWVRAVEDGDLQGEVFPLDERAKTTMGVVPRDEVPTDPNRREVLDLLSRRASSAASYLTNKHGQIAASPTSHRPWGLIIAGLCVLALVLGFLSDRLVNHGRINVISAPLLGILAWNALVYLWNLVSPLLGKRADALGLQGLLAPVLGIGRDKVDDQPDSNPPWGKLRGNFLARWTGLTGRPDLHRLTGALHLAAACFAGGQIGGLYLSGLVRRYLAVWESTFLDAPSFERLASILFGPASKFFNIPVEVTENMNAATGGGVDARDWIHLCAATLLLFVVLPRIVLALASRFRAARAWKSATAELEPDLGNYARDLLRQITKSGKDVAVISYGLDFPETSHEALRRSILHAIGKPGSLRFVAGPSYGEEDEYLSTLGTIPDIAILLFPLTGTPEEETQGVLAELVAKAVGNGSDRGTLGLLYADRFHEKFRDQPEFEDRLTRREEIWAQVLVPRGVAPFSWNTTAPASETGDQIIQALRGTEPIPTHPSIDQSPTS